MKSMLRASTALVACACFGQPIAVAKAAVDATSRNKYWKSAAAALGVMAMASNAAAFDGGWRGSYGNSAPDLFGPQDPYAQLSLAAKIELLRKKVKYVS